ncbi:MAG: hypothetical protein KME42_17640 [Tildeniella nuda ZEHNDER 1965/U140]|jgi:hypothetical protein|nr:hypothetical protein [Tildeniella nuda ZEHNDER 1965/U140]
MVWQKVGEGGRRQRAEGRGWEKAEGRRQRSAGKFDTQNVIFYCPLISLSPHLSISPLPSS